MSSPLVAFLIAAALSIVLNVILKKFNVSTIIGYILTGILISQIFGFHGEEKMAHLAEFGIVFLMFTIGLEFSIKHLMSMKKEVFLNGFLQVLLSGIIFSVIMYYLFGMSEKYAIVVGLTLALSSTAIVLKSLNESGDIYTIYGRKVLGILLFQDIAVIPILLMIDIFTSKESSINELLTTTATSAVIVFALMYIIGKYFLNKILFLVVKTDSKETFIATILFLVLGASYLANLFGFSYSLGAFMAGMLIAETKYKYQIEADLVPFRDLLLGLFFITVGLQVNFDIVFHYLFLIILSVIVVMAIKATVVFLILATYVDKRIALKSAIAVSQVGEFALAIFALSQSNGLLDSELAQILISIVIVSMIATPFILKNLSKIATKFLKQQKVDDFKIKSGDIKDHIIVCGYGKLGQEIVYRLKRENIPYLVIENNINLVYLGKARNETVFFGNASQKSILKAARIQSCKAIILAIDNEHNLMLVCEAIESFKQDIKTLVKVKDYEEKKQIEALEGKFFIINEGREIAKALIQEAL